MPRKSIPILPDRPYSITVRCNNKNWFELPMHEVWEVMQNYLFFMHHAYGVQILSFVLMSNHFHLLAIFPRLNMASAMQYFLRETSRQLGRETGHMNHLYTAHYYKSLIDSHDYFQTVYRYIYQNPVRAGICQNVEDYPYSTLHGLLGKSQLLIPIEEDLTLFSDPSSCLEWLNAKTSDASAEQIRKGLRLSVFELRRCRQTGKIGELDLPSFLDAPHAQKVSDT